MSSSSWLQARSFYFLSRASNGTTLTPLDVLVGFLMTLDGNTALNLIAFAYYLLKNSGNVLLRLLAYYHHDRIPGITYSRLRNLWSFSQSRRKAFIQRCLRPLSGFLDVASQSLKSLEGGPTPVSKTLELPVGSKIPHPVALEVQFSDGHRFEITGTANQKNQRTTILSFKNAKYVIYAHPSRERFSDLVEDREPRDINIEISPSVGKTMTIKGLFYTTLVAGLSLVESDKGDLWLVAALRQGSHEDIR